jgi:uncharacterized protein YukE
MALSYLEVDTGSLKADAKEMDLEIRQAKASLEELSEELEALNVMWSGSANLAFRTQARADVANVSELLEMMSALIDSCKNAVREYNRCEAEVLVEVNNIRI